MILNQGVSVLIICNVFMPVEDCRHLALKNVETKEKWDAKSFVIFQLVNAKQKRDWKYEGQEAHRRIVVE